MFEKASDKIRNIKKDVAARVLTATLAVSSGSAVNIPTVTAQPLNSSSTVEAPLGNLPTNQFNKDSLQKETKDSQTENTAVNNPEDFAEEKPTVKNANGFERVEQDELKIAKTLRGGTIASYKHPQATEYFEIIRKEELEQVLAKNNPDRKNVELIWAPPFLGMENEGVNYVHGPAISSHLDGKPETSWVRFKFGVEKDEEKLVLYVSTLESLAEHLSDSHDNLVNYTQPEREYVISLLNGHIGNWLALDGRPKITTTTIPEAFALTKNGDQSPSAIILAMN